ncbi:MAG: regulatory protein RecX [Firmicutes bacterium]|nr:regulatory protein RecX [Bacillota bacterium]
MKPKEPALSYALTLLGRRDYSTRELERKLEGQGYQREEIMAALARLREWNYLDDATYLRRQIDKHLAAKKSRSYIRQRLCLAGLDPQLVEEGLDLYYPPAQERENVRFWWQKYFGDPECSPQDKRVIIRWARRMYAAGFPAEEIHPYLDDHKES